MRLLGALNSHGSKHSRKRQAIEHIVGKLEKTRVRLEADLKVETSQAKAKKLQTRLKTNKKQHKKAQALLAELD